MDELAVEAVESLEPRPGPDTPAYILYGGKGGVGKTTMAAASALASARSGTPTLVVSTDPAHSLSDVFESPIPKTPARINEEVPLYAVEIDPDAVLGEASPFGPDGDFGGLGGIDGLLDDAMGAGGGDFGAEGSSMPGADEAAAMHQLLRYMDDDRFERVVVDTAPTGHTLRLLELPEVMDSMMGRIVQLRERFREFSVGVSGMFGGDDETPSADLDALREGIERLRATLCDPTATDFRVVMVPEGMSVVESRWLTERLARFDIPVGTVVVNRVLEDPNDVLGTEPGTFVAPDLDGCAFCARRWQTQQRALQEAQTLFRGNRVHRVPLFADEVRGERMLRAVGACLS